MRPRNRSPTRAVPLRCIGPTCPKSRQREAHPREAYLERLHERGLGRYENCKLSKEEADLAEAGAPSTTCGECVRFVRGIAAGLYPYREDPLLAECFGGFGGRCGLDHAVDGFSLGVKARVGVVHAAALAFGAAGDS